MNDTLVLINGTSGNATNSTGPMLDAQSSSNWLDVFFRSLAIVGVAELFDKTWFMGLLLAIRYNARTVFIGSFLALFLHTFLAAALGYAFARFVSPKILAWATCAIFWGFALLYAKDCYMADPEADAIGKGKEEAGEDMDMDPVNVEDHNAGSDDEADFKGTHRTGGYSSSSSDGGGNFQSSENLAVLGKSFMGVFIAEWGDRTQIAMIGQHASQPLIPVFLGSTVAFFLLTLSAVMAATFLRGQKLRERVVFGFSSLCFAVFGCFALHDALTKE